MRTILNLGCGFKTAASPEVINVDWSIYMRLSKRRFLLPLIETAIGERRSSNLRSVNGNLLIHDLRKGIPFGDQSIDAVYHSHFIEHIPRNNVPGLLAEIYRVLKPGGIHRISCPDLERIINSYNSSIKKYFSDSLLDENHDHCIRELLEQSVRNESFWSSKQPPLRRFLENLILGDPRKRGELHLWMYDRINLSHLLGSAGFSAITFPDYNNSLIPKFDKFRFEVDDEGREYLPGSLYCESKRS